jgi:hypothetical protein
MIIGAGRVTATAHAAIGASEARRKAWVRGCVQMCDDARPFDDDPESRQPLRRRLPSCYDLQQ